MSERYSANFRLIFLTFIALAFSIRTVYFYQTITFLQPGSGSDAYFYLEWAKEILRGHIFGKDIFYALPVYPYFLSLAYLFAGGEIFALVLIQILIGSLNCGLIYLLGKKLFSHQVGILASGMACAYQMFIFYDRMLLPSSFGICLGLLLALLLLEVKANPSIGRWVIPGLFLGLCTLTMASYFLLGLFILFWMFFEYKAIPLKKTFLYCLSFILSFFLLITAVGVKNYFLTQDFVLTTAHSGINFYIGTNPQADGLFKPPANMRPTQNGLIVDSQVIAEQLSARRLKASQASNFWFKQALEFVQAQPLNYLKLLGRKFSLFWNAQEFVDEIEYYLYNEKAQLLQSKLLVRFSLICPLAILGMLLSWPKSKDVALLYLFVASLSLGTISFFINSRYRLGCLPYLIIFAAFGLYSIWQKFKSKEYKNFVWLIILFSALYFLTNIKIGEPSAQNFTFHYNKGVISYDEGQYQMAAQEFKIALGLNPIDFMSYLGLGNTYHQMHDYAQAITSYKQSIAINPYYYDAYFNLGIVYNELGKTSEAEKQFQRVVALKPDDYAGHYNLGKLYQGQGKIDLAFQEYQQALKANPTHPQILQAIEELKDGGDNEK